MTKLTKQDLIDFETEIAACFDDAMIRAPVHLYNGNEEKMIERTVSHIYWLNRVQELTAEEETALRETGKIPTLPPNTHYYGKYNPATNTVSLRTLSGRIVAISLDHGKVVRGRKRRAGK